MTWLVPLSPATSPDGLTGTIAGAVTGAAAAVVAGAIAPGVLPDAVGTGVFTGGAAAAVDGAVVDSGVPCDAEGATFGVAAGVVERDSACAIAVVGAFVDQGDWPAGCDGLAGGDWLGGDCAAALAASSKHAGKFTGASSRATKKVEVLSIERPGTRDAAGNDCAGYLAVTVAEAWPVLA